MNESEIVALDDTSATRHNISRAEYILNHYAKTDVIALARDLDRYEAQQKVEPVIGCLYLAPCGGDIEVLFRYPSPPEESGGDPVVASFNTEAEALAFIESCRPKQEPAYNDRHELWCKQREGNICNCGYDQRKQEPADKCEKCDCFMVEHSADGTCPETNSATPYPDNTGQSDELPSFEDPRVQIAYQLLVDNESPPNSEEHWEGYTARRIVSALFDTSPRQSEQSDEAAFVEMFGPRPLINGRNIKGWTLAGWNQMHDGFLAGRQSSRQDVEIVSLIRRKFVSLNGVPVERITVKRSEIDAAIAAGKEGGE